MIKRIVKLTIRESDVSTFEEIFDSVKLKILAFPGCRHLELWRDISNPNQFFTYSYWDSPEDLNNYRHSDFFNQTWSKTKLLFADKPEAWSIEQCWPIVI